MAARVPITWDTFFAGDLTDLCNVAGDLGTDRDRGQFPDSAFVGVDYGRDLMALLDQRFPAVAIKNEILRSPALDGLDPTVTVRDTISIDVLGVDIVLGKDGIVSA